MKEIVMMQKLKLGKFVVDFWPLALAVDEDRGPIVVGVSVPDGRRFEVSGYIVGDELPEDRGIPLGSVGADGDVYIAFVALRSTSRMQVMPRTTDEHEAERKVRR